MKTPSGPEPDDVFYDCRRGGELVAGAPIYNRDTCTSDSGGPVYVLGPDGQYYLAGVTSRPVHRALRPCGDGGIYTQVTDAVQWLSKIGVPIVIASSVAVRPLKTGSITRSGSRGLVLAAQIEPSIIQGTSMKGKIRERADQRIYVEPAKEPGIRVPVRNSADIPVGVRGLPAKFQIEQEANGVLVRSIDLDLVSNLSKIKKDLPQVQFDSLHKSILETEKAADTLLKPSAKAAENRKIYGAAVKRTQNEYVRAYMKLKPEEKKEREVIIQGYLDSVVTTKSIYGRSDLFPPASYDQIFRNSRAAVAIARKDEIHPRSTGVLIGRDLILTCLHCIEGGLLQQWEVRFNYESDLNGKALTSESYPILSVAQKGRQISPNGPELDFALLRLGKGTEGKFAGEKWSVQCLSGTDVERDDPLYVIGFPEGEPRVVADNAFVYFPFRVSEFDYNRLLLSVEAEFQEASDRSQRLEEFRTSYRKTKFRGEQIYEYFALKWGGQPTFGADSDTYHGNSGSPVYKKRSHRLVGLLIAGASDVRVSVTPGWRTHEAILPISKIIEQLDNMWPKWRSEPQVCVQ